MSFFRNHSNLIIALGAGIAVGATITVIVHRVSNTFGRDLVRLAAQIESLKKDLALLKKTLDEKNKRKARGFYSVHASSGEDDDDEFQEAFEGSEGDALGGDQSVTSEDYVSVRSSDSLVSLDHNKLFKEVDTLLDGNNDDTQQALDLLQDKEKSIEGARGNEDKKKSLIYQSKGHALKSLELNSKDPNAHKWCAIALGSASDYEGTQAKILNGYKFKEHIEKAIEIEPSDPSSLHLMGRWCYGVYMLSWLERKAAATLFATPPTSTVDEALDNFLKADKLSSFKWKENMLFIAKCYIEKREYYTAVEWLDKAKVLENVSQDDKDSQKEIDSLLYKYSGYRR